MFAPQIVASILACAAAVPSGLLAAPYSVGIAPALPTISAGDINGAAIEAHVEASDHVRAAVDATRQVQDKVNELHGQAINNAEEHAWRVVDDVKTVEARLDGAAAAAAPVLSKQLVRQAPVVAAPVAVSYAAPEVAHYSAPLVAPYSAPYPAPVFAAPYSAYPAPNFVNPYYASPLGYSQW